MRGGFRHFFFEKSCFCETPYRSQPCLTGGWSDGCLKLAFPLLFSKYLATVLLLARRMQWMISKRGESWTVQLGVNSTWIFVANSIANYRKRLIIQWGRSAFQHGCLWDGCPCTRACCGSLHWLVTTYDCQCPCASIFTGICSSRWKFIQASGRLGRDPNQSAIFITLVEDKCSVRGLLKGRELSQNFDSQPLDPRDKSLVWLRTCSREAAVWGQGSLSPLLLRNPQVQESEMSPWI